MAPHLLGIKSTMGLYSGSQSVDGKDSVLDKGESTSRSAPESGSPPSSLRCQSEDTFANATTLTVDLKVENLDYHASKVLRLSHNFPLSGNMTPEKNLPLRQYLRNMLPSRPEAQYLWEQMSRNALWQYNPHPSTTFFPTLVYHCYETPIQDTCPRRLALMFMILAVGCQVDTNQPPDTPDSERYHQFAQAALCEIPVMEEVTVATILALFYEIWYLLVFSDKKKAAGYAWGLMGLTAKLAQSIGLHRNGNKTKAIPEEAEKRRTLFWELLYLDAPLSLSLGRPPSLSLNYADCLRPSYGPSEGCDPTESLHHYQEWKHSCYVECLAPVLDAISNPSLEYSSVLELDKRIRDFSIPAPLRNGQSRALFLQRGSLSTALEAVLLQLHRAWFVRSLSNPEEPFNRWHKYAPSTLSVFLSASRMVATIEELFDREPQITARLFGYWSNAFSAAVALCLLVSRAPFTCFSPLALAELQRARILFATAADTCLRASEVKPMLDIMIDKANDIYNRWCQGQVIPNQHFDECSIQDGGQERHYQQQQQQRSYGQGPRQLPDPFAFVHPSLARCIIEVHQRANEMFPMHKTCHCSAAKRCSQAWGSQPNVPHASSVLPGLTSPVLAPAGLYNQSISTDTSMLRPSTGDRTGPVPSSSSMFGLAVVNPLSIEIGAISINSDQGLMSFF